jgi:hypothetical protein
MLHPNLRRLVTVAIASTAIGCSDQANPMVGGDAQADAPSVGLDASSDAPATFDAASVSASTWVTSLVASYCDRALRCGTFPDDATCKAYMGPQFSAVNFNAPSAAVKAVSDGKASFDPTQAATCLTALSNLDCAVDFLNAGIPACAAAFSGHVSDGGACIDDVECASGSMCIVASTATCEGTCTPASGGLCRMDSDCAQDQFCAAVSMQGAGVWGSGGCEARIPPGANGEPCGMPVQCAPGFFCVGGPAPARCAAFEGAGATCVPPVGFACAPGLACVASDDGTTRTCVPPAKLGDACTSLFQCGGQYVSSDIICDVSGTHTCVRRPSAGPCVVVQGISTCDPVTSYCEATSGTCKPWISQGAACVFPSSGIDPCTPWTSCGMSTCASLLTACTPQ